MIPSHGYRLLRDGFGTRTCSLEEVFRFMTEKANSDSSHDVYTIGDRSGHAVFKQMFGTPSI
jgi:hypothetical protein